MKDVDSGGGDDLFYITNTMRDYALKTQVINLPPNVIDGSCRSFYLSVNPGPTQDYDWASWVSAYIARP
jgi:hypothetical protein